MIYIIFYMLLNYLMYSTHFFLIDIDKIYNDPKPLRAKLSPSPKALLASSPSSADAESLHEHSSTSTTLQPALADFSHPPTSFQYFRRNLIVFKNFDLLRAADLFVVVIIFHCWFPMHQKMPYKCLLSDNVWLGEYFIPKPYWICRARRSFGRNIT